MDEQYPLPKLEFQAMQFSIRPLSADDTLAYRALRQKIRKNGGGKYFSDSYEREDQLNEKLWREWCSAKREHCIIGTLHGQKLIGIMMITAQGPADSLVAEWEATWLESEYRRFGVARQAYEEVYKWTKKHGYQHAVVFIREDNARSREIREGQGFAYLRTKHGEVWADGSIADTNLFVLDLFPDCPVGENPNERAICRLEATLESMKGEVPFIGEAIQKRIEALRPEMVRTIRGESRHSAQLTASKR